MSNWIPVQTKSEVLESEHMKEGFVGSSDSPPTKQYPHAHQIPVSATKNQKTWPSFTYVPPPAVIDMREWRFETYGLVNRPLSLTYAELKTLPTVTSLENHTCDDMILTTGHKFEGIDFRTIVELTQPDPDCEWILFECDGGHTVSHSIHKRMMLAYRRNGEPLDPSHGYPLRAWIPGDWGGLNPKWVRRIKFCERRDPDFYMTYLRQRGADPSILAALYKSHVGSGAPIEAINDFLAFFYKTFWWDVRHSPMGARGKGIATGLRAPVYLGDDTWADYKTCL